MIPAIHLKIHGFRYSFVKVTALNLKLVNYLRVYMNFMWCQAHSNKVWVIKSIWKRIIVENRIFLPNTDNALLKSQWKTKNTFELNFRRYRGSNLNIHHFTHNFLFDMSSLKFVCMVMLNLVVTKLNADIWHGLLRLSRQNLEIFITFQTSIQIAIFARWQCNLDKFNAISVIIGHTVIGNCS